MGFFRARLRHGSLLALIALGLQLVLSFGHVHFGQVHADSLHIGPFALHANIAADGASDHPSPVDHDGHDVAGFCAICAVTTMVGALVLPAATDLPLPPLQETSFENPAVALLGPTPRCALFQPRAPPSA